MPKRKSPALTIAAVVVLAVVTLGLVAAAVLRDPEPPASAREPYTPSPPSPPPAVAFLGDSYTEGTAWDSGERVRWRNALARERGWQARNFGVSGTGYLTTGLHGDLFRDRVPDIVAADPDMVVIAGGANDTGLDPEDVANEASAVLDALKEGLPDADLVMLSPFWWDDPTDTIAAITDELAAVADEHGITYIDVSEAFAGEHRALIADDGIHPTDEGHARIVELLVEEMPEPGA